MTAIDALIKTGQYDTVHQFLEAAVQNQLFIQQLPLGPLGTTEGAASSITSSRILEASQRGLAANLLVRPRAVLLSSEPTSATKKTLWGLYNRIFPSKITLRVLANLAEEAGKEFVDVDMVQEEAGKQARLIGQSLVDIDEKVGHQHGEKLSTGLPVGKQDKSLARYSDMFVGYLKSDGVAEGLPSDLGFVIIKLDAKGRGLIALTEMGKQFLQMSNPILDRQNDGIPDSTLSEDETDFLLSRIRDWLPSEWERYQKVLSAISHGENEPDKLDVTLRAQSRNLGSDAISTERAGIVSRLAELGLVRRRREGLRVRYSLTTRGEHYLRGTGKVGLVA